MNIAPEEPRDMGSLWAGVTVNMLPTMCSGNSVLAFSVRVLLLTAEYFSNLQESIIVFCLSQGET